MVQRRGQAAVELLLVAPFVVAVLLGCAQALVVAWADVCATDAARAAGRAAEVGGDPRRAALTALPVVLRSGAVVSARAPFTVRLHAPVLVPGADLSVVEP
jgi:TadE-like protein